MTNETKRDNGLEEILAQARWVDKGSDRHFKTVGNSSYSRVGSLYEQAGKRLHAARCYLISTEGLSGHLKELNLTSREFGYVVKSALKVLDKYVSRTYSWEPGKKETIEWIEQQENDLKERYFK